MGCSSRLPAGPSPARPSHNIAAIHTAAAPKRQRGLRREQGCESRSSLCVKGAEGFWMHFPSAPARRDPGQADRGRRGRQRMNLRPLRSRSWRRAFVGREARNLLGRGRQPARTPILRRRWAGKFHGGGPAKGQTLPAWVREPGGRVFYAANGSQAGKAWPRLMPVRLRQAAPNQKR